MVENIRTDSKQDPQQEIMINTADQSVATSLHLNQVLQDDVDFAKATEAYFAELYYKELSDQNPLMSDKMAQDVIPVVLSELAAVREKFIKYARYYANHEMKIDQARKDLDCIEENL